MAKAMYIHIPFCDQICSYCDFAKLYTNPVFVSGYLDSLLKEIKSRYQGEELATLYFGGGTPSALKREELRYLLNGLSFLNLSHDCEITFEANPENLTFDKIQVLRDFGVNRVSLGAQTFHLHHLKFLNRGHTDEDIINTISSLKRVGIENINLDLMFGFPDETLNEVIDDLDSYLAIDIPHISMYSLIIEQNTVIEINGIKSIDEELEAVMYEEIIDRLKENGYDHYEISNFAKPGYESKHNLVYWDNDEYYGFGLGAHGYINGVRYENTRNIKAYNDEKWLRLEKSLTVEEKMQEFFFLGLRKSNGVNLSDFTEKYQKNAFDLFEIQVMIDKGYLIIRDNYLKLSEKGRPLANEVFEIFV